MQLTVKERVFILERYLKTIHPLQTNFFEKFRRQAPVKSVKAIEEVNEGTL
jgi:hypothetical protein